MEPERKMRVKRIGLLRLLLIIFTALCLPLPGKSNGAETEPVAGRIDEMVVTSTRKEKKIKELPGSVSVINRAEIERSNAVNVTELISEVPGITVNGSASDGSTLSVSLRGLDPSRTNKVLVLVNGVPMNNSWTGTVYWYDLPSPNQIERIEILKGPVSAIYGGWGIGGCINIITRRGPVEPETNIKAAFGSYNKMEYSAATGGNLKNRLSYQLGANYQKTDGYRDRSAAENYGASTMLGWMFTDRSDIEWDLGYSNIDTEIAGSLTLQQFEEDPKQAQSQFGRREMERIYNNLTFRQDIGRDDNLKVTLYYHTLDYDYVFASSSNRNCVYDTYTSGGEIQYTLNHTIGGKKNTLIFGPTFRYDRADSKTYDTINGKPDGAPTDDTLSEPLFWAVYFQDEILLFDPLTLTIGMRYDKAEFDQKDRITPEDSGGTSMDAYSPMLGIAYRLFENTTLFGNLGKGFAVPSTSKLYGSNGNPDLKPETAINYEVGIRTSSLDGLNLTATIYRMDVQDEIVTAQVDGESRNVNTGETRHQGVEAELEITLPHGFSPFINYTYQNAEYTVYSVYSSRSDRHSVYDHNKIPHVSEHLLTAGIKYQHPAGVNFKLSARHESEKYTDSANEYKIPGYTIWESRLEYEGSIRNTGYSVYLSAENLFDKNYYYKGSGEDVYPADPLTFTAGATLNF